MGLPTIRELSSTSSHMLTHKNHYRCAASALICEEYEAIDTAIALGVKKRFVRRRRQGQVKLNKSRVPLHFSDTARPKQIEYTQYTAGPLLPSAAMACSRVITLAGSLVRMPCLMALSIPGALGGVSIVLLEMT